MRGLEVLALISTATPRKERRDARLRRPEKRILVLGQYVDEPINIERALPSPGWAGSNRMRRLASAMKMSGQRVTIVAPGTALRMRRTKRLLHHHRVRRAGRVSVVFARAVGLPVLGLLLEPLFLAAAIGTLARKREVKVAMVYNFSPGLLICALLLKAVWHVSIVLDLEDVYIPRLSDWRRASPARPWQQLVYWMCMRGLLEVCDRVIVPTRRFLRFVPKRKPSLIVTGCLDVEETPRAKPRVGNGPLRVLMAGKLDQENGFDMFVAAAESLQIAQDGREFEFHACGSATPDTRQLTAVQFHGALSATDYRHLLGTMDVCVVLQKPEGRWAGLKTPSKVYEFLGAGKIVVATDAGDYVDLTGPFLRLCKQVDVETLSAILREIRASRELLSSWSQQASCFALSTFSAVAVGQRLASFVGERAIPEKAGV